MQSSRSIYGGATVFNGSNQITLLGFNHEGNPVTIRAPIGTVLNALTRQSDKFQSVTKATAIYLNTEGLTVRCTVVDDKMKLIHETLPLDKLWPAMEQLGKFEPVNVHEAASVAAIAA